MNHRILPFLAQPNPPVPTSADLNPALVAFAAIPILLLVLLALHFSRRRRARSADLVCGKCGYVVAGLPTFTCPECGSDLRQVGIERDARPGALARLAPTRDAVSLAAWLALWTLLYTALYACVGTGSYPLHDWDNGNRPAAYGVVDGYLWPYRGRSTHTVTLEPRSDAYRRITITERREAGFRGWRSAPEPKWTGNTPNVGLTAFTISLQMDTNDGKSATMDIDPATLTWRSPNPNDPANPATGPLDDDTLWGWIYGHGVDQASDAVRPETAYLVDLVKRSVNFGKVDGPPATGRLERIAIGQRDAITNPMFEYPFKSIRGTAADAYGPAWSIYWLSIPFGLGVYTYGMNWIFAWQKRRATPAAPPPPGLPEGGSAAEAATVAAATATAAADAQKNRRRSRTLTILFTDLKDYTARTEAASRDGLRWVIAKNREIVEGAVSATDGTIVKSIGDAFLITYESATDAVLAGLEIQRAAARYNASVAAAGGDGRPPIEYRIAVCTGEVTLDHGDVFGTPVNVAARVQALAEPGSVYFTESTLHAINPAEVTSAEIGPHDLKGIAAPVRLYRAGAGDGAS